MLAAVVCSLGLAAVAVSGQGVYIPGGAGQAQGASLATLGAGSDGFTAYEINGVILAENGQQVMMTSVDAAGTVVYDCQLGADAQATCNVVQQYDGVQYAYTEPITYFGGALATPSVSASVSATTTTDDSTALSSATPTAVVAAVSTTAASSSTATSSAPTSSASSPAAASSSSASTAPTKSLAGPQAGAAQSTSSNIFLPAGASASDSATSGAGARHAGAYGCGAALLGALAWLAASA